MGFWDGLSKLAKGEPVYGSPEPKDPHAGEVAKEKEKSTVVDERGNKIIPEIEIRNCRSKLVGDKMEVTAWVTNTSEVVIELDKIILAGLTTELDRILSPREAREMKLYSGEPLTDEHHHVAGVQYKRRDNGDYFRADFEVEYNHDSRGFYEVEELHPVSPIRDI